MNFALILFLLLVVTGVIVGVDRQFFATRRKARLATALAEVETAVQKKGGETDGEFAARKKLAHDTAAKRHAEPWWTEYSRSFFPVILIVFLLRSFLVEPFKIPSGSMLPTLLVGDFILVNKFTYGVRLPIVNRLVIPLGKPERGDVMVFRYPNDESVDYIKRVVGLPGDKITWAGKRLTINGEPVPTVPAGEFVNRDRIQVSKQYKETFGGRDHLILLEDDAPPLLQYVEPFPHRDNCHYTQESVTCTVPEGHYFMMGDNRDNSQDSRVWGFVPDRNIVGKAFFIWFNASELSRIGSFK